jgi:hypothetical protein
VVTVAVASALTWGVISLTGSRVGQPAPVAIPTTSATSAWRNPDTWIGAAGKVTARCKDAVISLVAATPADGYRVEIKDRGPVQLSFEFERGEADKETRLRATCVDGHPAFTKE